jgi:hypothetical protein
VLGHVLWQYPCAAGRWSADRGLSTNCTNLCDAGFYCQQGSTYSNPQTCGGAAFYCPEGSGAPISILPGNYSIGGPVETDTMRTGTAPCPFGSNYCLGDGLSRVCPAGVYGNASGLATPLCSGPCSPGYFCPSNSTSPEQGDSCCLWACVVWCRCVLKWRLCACRAVWWCHVVLSGWHNVTCPCFAWLLQHP